MSHEQFDKARFDQAKQIIHDESSTLRVAKKALEKRENISPDEQEKIAKLYQRGVRNLLKGKVDFKDVAEADAEEELNQLVLAIIKAELFDETEEPGAPSSPGTGTDSGKPKEATNAAAKVLTDAEMAKVKKNAQLEALIEEFLKLNDYLGEYEKVNMSNVDLREAYLTFIKTLLVSLTLDKVSTLVVTDPSLGDSRDNIIAFSKSIIKRAQGILNPVDKAEFSSLKLESAGDANAVCNSLQRLFKERYVVSADIAVDWLIETANEAFKAYSNSGSGISGSQANRIIGTYYALAEFGNATHVNKPGDEYIPIFALNSIHDEKKRKEQIIKLRRKATELINFAYIENVTRKMTDINSMTSDWEQVYKYSKEQQNFFRVANFDIMIQPELHDPEKGKYGYRFADALKWALWKMPNWIIEYSIEVKKEGGYSDRDGDARGKFNTWLEQKIFNEFAGASDKAISSDVGYKKEKGKSAIEKLTVSAESIRALFEGTTTGFDEETGKNIYSNPTNRELFNFFLILHSFSSTLGIRMNTFRADLARGTTPAGGLQTHRRWMTAVCPYALDNYNCYKGLSPHISAEGFECQNGLPVDYDPNDPNGEVTFDEKIFNMNLSKAKTLELVRSISGPLRRRVVVGDLSSKDPAERWIDNIYPDFYTLTVRDFDRRKDVKENRAASRVTDIPAWFEGLLAVEIFVGMALSPSLGTNNPDEIKKMPKDQAMKKMINALESLVQSIVSPMKTNQEWVRWDHVAQLLLIFIDRMYRSYGLIDDSEGGFATLTRKIRLRVSNDMANLGGVGREGSYLKYEPGEKTATPTNSPVTTRSKLIGSRASDVGIDSEGERRLDRKRVRNNLELRDYVMNRIARATGLDFTNQTIFINGAVVVDKEKSDATGILAQIGDKLMGIVSDPSVARARPRTMSRLDAFIVRPVTSFAIESSKFFNKDSVEEFYKECMEALLGTPTADQKKTVEEKAEKK